MRIKSLLSGSLLIIATTTLLVSEWRAQTQQSSVQYKSRRQLQVEVYFKESAISEPMTTLKSDKHKSITVTPTPIIVGERELVSISSSDLDIKNTYDFSKEEVQILERITEAEAEGQDIDSKKNVCSNIINRYESDQFPKSIKKIVFQKSQYSSTTDGRYDKVEISKDTKDAVQEIIRNGVTHDCLYFFSLKDIKSQKIKNWINNSLEFEFKDSSGHSYYNEKKR